MSNRLFRFLMLGLMCLSLAGVAACGDDDEPQDGNNGPECTTDQECSGDQICEDGTCVDDTPECSDNADCGDDEFCAEDGQCVAGCDDDDACEGDLVCLDDNSCGCTADGQCGGDQVCENNTCVTPDAQCQAVGDPCGNSNAPLGEGFVCLVTEQGAQQGECFRSCSPGAAQTGCTSGTYCAELSQPGAGACLTSECSGVDDFEGCQDEIDANPDSFPYGANCVPEGNDAFTCEPAGPLEEGDTCGQGFEGCSDDSDCPTGGGWSCNQDVGGLCLQECSADAECGTGFSCENVGGGLNICFPQTCGEGMTCGFDGTCSTLCDGDETCGGDQRCIGDDTGVAGESGWGICGEGCDAGDGLGQCGEGLGCFPVSDEDGICTEAGDTPAYQACDVPTSCEVDADCPTDGWTCNNDSGTCEETCSTDNDCSGDGTCDIPETADTGFCVQPTQCAEGSRCLNMGDGEGRCLPVCDPRADNQADRDATCPSANPVGYARFVHLAQGEGDVDIYVDDTLVVDNRSEAAGTATPVAGSFTSLEPGFVTIEVVDAADADNSSPLASHEATISLNNQLSFAIVHDDAGALDIIETQVPRGVAAPAAGEGRVNFQLDADLGMPVDVYILDDEGEFAGDEIADFTDLAYGEATEFSGDLAAGDYDVYLFEAGTTEAPLYSVDVTVPADTTATLHLWGTPAGGEIGTLSATAVEYDEADVAGNNGYCYDLSTDQPSISSGICFERCTGPEAYGQGTCTESADHCSTFGANHLCLPSDEIAVGQSCEPGALNACEEGAYCRPTGQTDDDGTAMGVCAKQCVPGGTANPILGCPTDQTCEPLGDEDFNFGECGYACEPADIPTDFSSPDCTEDFLGACVPETIGESAFCSASGDVPVDAACGEVSANNCVPSAVCRRDYTGEGLNETLFGPIQGVTGDDNGVCRQRCELFAEDSGCPAGQACTIDATTLSTDIGFCAPANEELADLDPLGPCGADSLGMMCGEGSVCTNNGGTARCIEFCDLDDPDACGLDFVCDGLFGDTSVRLGICVAP